MNRQEMSMNDNSRWTDRKMTRRQALAAFGVLGVGALVGCTPLKVGLRIYPEEFNSQPDLADSVLRSFVETVIPGASSRDETLVQVYYDEYYPFANYRNYFCADLCKRAQKKYGENRFDRLSPEQRTHVVQDGLNADRITARLYNGAIFLAQISFYAGIYDDKAGCRLIGYEGRNWGVPLEDQTYPNPEQYLASPMTANGNCV